MTDLHNCMQVLECDFISLLEQPGNSANQQSHAGAKKMQKQGDTCGRQSTFQQLQVKT